MRGVKRAVTPKVKNGVLWLDFNYKPSWNERKALKRVGFRWSPGKGAWYGKNTRESREVAKSFNLTEFIPVPKATGNDFVEWQKSLTRNEWHELTIQANSVYSEIIDANKDAVQFFTNYLHDKFIKQWA